MNTEKTFQYYSNAIRVLAMDAVQKANSGHPGMPMGMADVAYVLWAQALRHNPQNPLWPNRDRFVLSAGHGSMLLYSLLYLTGYPLTLEDLQQFRQWGSKTPGHPEYDPAMGIETTTGPLGQGFANGVGMALAQAHLAARFNRPEYAIFDHFIYAIVSDGDLMEGVSQEAASLAGHWGLDKLIYFYDDNEISIEGSTDLAFTEDVPARFRAYGWHIQEVDAYDHAAIQTAIETAQAAKGQPHLIVCHSHIAHGSPNMHDNAEAHGAPLGEAEVKATKEALGWPSLEPFYIPDDVLAHWRQSATGGAAVDAAWQAMAARYAQAYPAEAAELQRILSGKLPDGWQSAVPAFAPGEKPAATRNVSGVTLSALMKAIPDMIGGSADLSPSNKTYVKGLGDFQKATPEGRNLHFGIREHAMGGILNGMATYPGIRPFGGTFMVFSDYMRPAVRVAALMQLPIIYVWTHDSFYVGEDGPTHEPIEHLAALRAIPGLTIIRPADANETAAAWQIAVALARPVGLALTRQNLPLLTTADVALAGVARGAYVLSESPLGKTDLLLLASGSEVADAVGAQKLLAEKGVGARVVSMPSWELFEAQDAAYRESVLPSAIVKRLAVEAGVPMGWHRYVGSAGDVIGMNRFGASAPYQVLQREFGFTAEAIAARALALL
ncbi:MAG TPA: transketolase [Anaerolineae bacterium]|nr:transketolase [Anaerolineae bacterium]